MRIHELETASAFIAIDLDGAETSSGPVRRARKILRGGAEDLARSQTYTYAVLGMRRGGAAAGISADADDRVGAVAAFVEEATTLVVGGIYLPDPAKGVPETDLTPLRSHDPRATGRFAAADGGTSLVDDCAGLGAAEAADRAVGLAGRTVAIEGFGAAGPALAAAVVERGGRIIAVSTSAGAAMLDGADPSALAQGWAARGPDMVADLGAEEPAWKVFGAGADVIFAGSRMGAVDHETAAGLSELAALVPIGRLPFTAKALAVFRRAGVAALPDFVTLAGPTLALWGDEERSAADVGHQVTDRVAAIVEQTRHDDGPFLGACHEAESFLRTWRDELPFGRPLAP